MKNEDKMTKEKMDLLFLKSSLDKFFSNPILRFSYGVMYAILGVLYWHTDLLKNQLLDLGITSQYIHLLITGMCICAGYYYLSVYYDDFKKCLINRRND